jgi:beta-barrel assembly-enhancing protease
VIRFPKNNVLFFLIILIGAVFFHAFSNDSTEVNVQKADLIKQADESEGWFERQGLIVDDSAATIYLQSILDRLKTADSAESMLRIRFVRECSPNAFSFANGLLLMCTGVFAVVDNESQLAFLLAHEMSHCHLNHHVLRRHEMHRKSVELIRRQIVGAFFFGRLANFYNGRSLMRAMGGFSRVFEDQADRTALQKIIKAGYDARNAVKMFENLRTRAGGDNAFEDTTLITHPKLADRLSRAVKYLDSIKYPPEPAEKSASISFRQSFQKMYFVNSNECYTESDYDLALRNANELLAAEPLSSYAAAIKGTTFMTRRNGSDLDSAYFYLRFAANTDPSRPGFIRDLGYAFFFSGKFDSAAIYWRKYLQQAPDAADKAFIQYYLRNYYSE